MQMSTPVQFHNRIAIPANWKKENREQQKFDTTLYLQRSNDNFRNPIEYTMSNKPTRPKLSLL
jgi:hypothetical protein